MPLAAGTRLGPYEILSALGAGGMGEVYKARDTRLDRIVAIKVLSGALAADPAGRERFDREARAISALDHPHICALYDVGHQDGLDYLVMQYLEGETIATRLERGSLPLDQALTIATQIADALEKAHRQGIVHRDLKPSNIVWTKGGARLLDFGLARVTAKHAGILDGQTGLPTSPANLTAQGTILGTIQYMAPEQIEGQDADARTDIFAFGSVLYEMLTGRKAFPGKSPASVLGAILKDPAPRLSELQPLAPRSLDHVVTTCLAKDPEERWQSAADLKRELTWIAAAPADSGAAVRVVPRTRRSWAERAFAGGVGLAGGAGLVAAFVSRRAPAAWPVMHLQIGVNPADTLDPAPSRENARTAIALSPDGRLLAFVGRRGTMDQLFVRALDRHEAVSARPDLPDRAD